MKNYKDVRHNCLPKLKNDVEVLDESFLSALTTATTLTKSLATARRVAKRTRIKIDTKPIPQLRADSANLPQVLDAVSKNQLAIAKTLNQFFIINQDNHKDNAMLSAISVAASRLFVKPTRKRK